ncbi:MAG: DNA polymerase III subunit gamma/tau [Burkholderiales bacterium]|jgi:DNA polymerase-3 subunit gamma/tau|nr:DNA polymerase III subunit gamma/tau [Burkholderiales bacterium]
MSYQALARQWRPKTFAELVGQTHVVTALQNALTRGRIHHAYLLTGTRGVGKTTLARILAKSLNCEQGVTATPCGRCAACMAIDEGRFVDLLELDAASNTGIDNMREILDNARYAPTVGRYKVYLIDEVHMLSKAAFNSMLKTLEEPPEHVKFVLATTDPQKIPVTVLSRCLQFSLKPLSVEKIHGRLDFILTSEKIPFENNGLMLIAQSARGSLRDALSLLDQAVAYGAGEVKENEVRAILGVVDRDYAYRMIDALAAQDGAALLAEVDQLMLRGLDVSAVLDELIALFHQIAVVQVAPKIAAEWDDVEKLETLATRFSPEEIQLFYQIGLQGRADLVLAPDETMGLSMTLLRLLAFSPDTEETSPPATAKPVVQAVAQRVTAVKQMASQNPEEDTRKNETMKVIALPENAESWTPWLEQLHLKGMAAQLASHTEWRGFSGNEIILALPETQRHLAEKTHADKLEKALEMATGKRLRLKFEWVESTETSQAAQKNRKRKKEETETENAFRNAPFVQALEREGGKIHWDTVKKNSL